MHRMSLVVLAVALACLQLSAANVRTTATRRPTPAATTRRAVTVRPQARTAPARATTRRSGGSSNDRFAGPCPPGQNGSWFDGCNWCSCPTNGGAMACTLMYCPGNYRTIAGCPSGKAPGDTWFENCNSFSCQRSSNGTLTTSGTVNGRCWSDNSRTTRIPTVRPGATGGRGATSTGPCVTADSTWFDGCNNCRCFRGEPTACTRKGCPDHIQTIVGCPSGVTPGQSWYANCNRYTCVRTNGTIVTRHTTGGACW